MIEVGQRLKRDDGVAFDVVGTHGFAWLLAPVEFGPVERVTGRVLAERFDVAAQTPKQDDEHEGAQAMLRAELRHARQVEPGWHALADAHRQQSIALAQQQLDDATSYGVHHAD